MATRLPVAVMIGAPRLNYKVMRWLRVVGAVRPGRAVLRLQLESLLTARPGSEPWGEENV